MAEAVVITGHAGGIGGAMAEAFDSRGYRVIGVDQVTSATRVTAEVLADLASLSSSESERERVRAGILSALGGDRLAALVNNAALQLLDSLAELDTSALEQCLRVNAQAPLVLGQMLLDTMRGCGSTIVNVSSIHASQTKPEFAAYAASKAAFSALSRSMSIEWGGDIRVLELRPAAVATPMLEAGFVDDPVGREALDKLHPTGAISSPAELAALVVDLVQADAAFLNGAVINFDGGISSCLNDPAFG